MFVLVLIVLVALVLALHAYLAWRLIAVSKAIFSEKSHRTLVFVGYFVFLTAGIFLLLGVFLDVRFFAVFSAGYMGIFVNLLLSFLLIELVFLLLFRFFKKIKKRAVAHLAALLILPTLLSVYGFANAAIVRVTDYEIVSKQELVGMKIVMISDLHIGAVGSEKRLSGWVQKVNDEKADLILIAGDIFDSSTDKIVDRERVISDLSELSATYGIYAALGNHDAGKSYPDMLFLLEAAGITVLEDAFSVIDDRLIIAGRREGAPIGSAGENRLDTEDFLSTLPDKDLPVIVLDHNPADCLSYDDRVTLLLSGHTHKGQIFPGNLITALLYPIDYGLFRASDNAPYVIVSSGIGAWGMVMKTAGYSEIVSITFTEF